MVPMIAFIQRSDRPTACLCVGLAIVAWQTAEWVSRRRRAKRDDRNVVKFP